MRAPSRDTSKYCVFHKDIGNKIEDCKHLKKEIEDLLSRGYLGDLVGNDNRRINRPPQREVLRLPTHPINRVEPCNDDNVRTIHSIHGKLGLNETSNNAQKRYFREVYAILCVYNLHKVSPFISIIFISKDENSYPHINLLAVML